MKFKFGLVTLLMVGLLAIFSAPNAAMAALTVTTIADPGTTVAAGDSVVIAAFSVAAGAANETITSIAAQKNGATTIATTDLTAISLYEDVNKNGIYNPGVDIYIDRDMNADLTSGPTVWAAGGKTFTYTYTFAATADTKYFLIIASVEKTGTALDTKAIRTDYTVAGTGGPFAKADTAADAVNIEATHLQFLATGATGFADVVTAAGGGANLVAVGTTISAVDDYGNVDATITGAGTTLTFASYDLTTGAASVGAVSATALEGFGAADVATSGVWTTTAVTALKYANAANEDVVIVATEATTGIKGSIGFANRVGGTYASMIGVITTRGIEVYDTDKNGFIDRVAIFYNTPVADQTGNDIPDNGVATDCTTSAFTVTDGAYTYTVTSVKINQDNGGAGILNGGPYAVTLYLTERGGTNYDTGVKPEVTFNASAGKIYDRVDTDGVTPGNQFTSSPQIVAASAVEVDKARPVLMSIKTGDTDSPADGKVDSIIMTFSEAVTGVSIDTALRANAGAIGNNPSGNAASLALKNVLQDGTTITPITLTGTYTGTNVVTISVNETIPNTGILPVILYDDNDTNANGNPITDSATTATGASSPNAMVYDPTVWLADQSQSIFVEDGASPIINSVTTGDNSGDGKIDRMVVQFSENMNTNALYSWGGVTFKSSVGTFKSSGQTAYVTSAGAVATNTITFTITQADVYDTEATPVFYYNSTTGALYDANGFELAAYGDGTGGTRVQEVATVDGAAPVIISKTTGDNFTDTDYTAAGGGAGAAIFEATDTPNGRIDTFVFTFSEKVKTTNGNPPTGANLDAAVATLVSSHEDGGGASTAGPLTYITAVAAGANTDNGAAIPVWSNTDNAGDTGTTLTVHFREVSFANLDNAGASVNKGDTGVKPTIAYTSTGGANDFTDVNNVSLATFGASATTDKAAPLIVNGLRLNGAVSLYGPTSFANIKTMDRNAAIAGSANTSNGDGYIDSFEIFFSEAVHIAHPDTATIPAAFTVAASNGNTISATTIDVDKDGDTDAADATAGTGAGGVTSFYLYGTSNKAGSWDTGYTPALTYNGGLVLYDGTDGTYNVGVDNIYAQTGAQPTYDTAKPVYVRAIGGVDTDEIKVTWSENVWPIAQATDGVNPANNWAAAVNASTIFDYSNANAAGNASIKAGTLISSYDATNFEMVIKTTSTMTLSDVTSDSIWVIANNLVVDDPDAVHSGAGVDNQALGNAIKTGYTIIIDDPIAPWITSAKTVDADGDGLVDHIRFTFSEPIKLASVGTLNTMSADVASSWHLTGYTGTAKFNLFEDNNTGHAAANVAGKPVFVGAENFVASGYKTLYLEIEEGGVPLSTTGIGSTNYTPTLTFTAGVITDNKPNTLETSTAHFSGAVLDDAPPVEMRAEYTSTKTLKITFSEDLDTSAFDRTDINWTMSNVGTNYQNNVVNITEPTPGVLLYRTNEVFSWDSDFAGTVAITNGAGTIKDFDVDGTGPDVAKTAIANGADAYAGATWYNNASPAVAVTSPGNVNASLTIQVNIAGTTIAAPTALVTTDKPGDNGHYFYANFTPSSTTTVTSYLFFAWDANEATATVGDSTWVNFAAASVIPTTSGTVTYLVPTPYTGTMQYAVVASTGTAFSLLKAADGEVGIAELVETAAAKTADVQFSDFSCTAYGQATDNIPPAAFTIASANDVAGNGTGIEVTWNALGQVGTYGSTVQLPIYGADYYEIYRAVKGTTTYTKVGQTSDPTTSTFIDMVADGSTVYNYYVRAIDGFVLANPTTNVITGTKAAIASIGGADYNSDNVVGYTDFILFASYFNTTSTDAGFVSNYDLNADGKVDNDDFILFAVAFNETASKVAKIAEMPSSSVSLNMNAEFDAASSVYYVTVNLSETAVDGFQLNMSYDTNRMEYIQNSITGLGDLSIIKTDENGILVNAAFINGEEFGGTVTLAFRSKDSNTEANFELVNALVTVDDVTGTIGKLASASVKATPTVYGLAQNYPNPFNPTTTIDYTIPTAGSVELIVYNMSGQKVRTLVNEVQSPAFYKVVWDGKNDRGESVASGLYFYKLVSGSFSKTAKMNLVK